MWSHKQLNMWGCLLKLCLLGGVAVLAHTVSSKTTMNASDLLVPSPFGRAFLRAPPWLQEALRHYGFGLHQSDGHVLVHSCVRLATAEDELVLHTTRILLTLVPASPGLLPSAISSTQPLPGWGAEIQRLVMEVHQQMLELLPKWSGSSDGRL